MRFISACIVFQFLCLISIAVQTSLASELHKKVNISKTKQGSDAIAMSSVSTGCDQKMPANCPTASSENHAYSCGPKKKSGYNHCGEKIHDLCVEDQLLLEACHKKNPLACEDQDVPKGYSEEIKKRVNYLEENAKPECFDDPEDYAAASVLYIHGGASEEHLKPAYFIKAFHLASKALELGDECHRRFILYSITWYLSSIDIPENGKLKKYIKPEQRGDERRKSFDLGNGTLPNGCPCYSVRKGTAISDIGLQLACQNLRRSTDGKVCPLTPCNLEDPLALPKGILPGFW
jgi:hypothetical protein